MPKHPGTDYSVYFPTGDHRFPPPWPVEELDAMTRPTKSKIEAIKPDQQDFNAVEKEYGPLPPNASQAALAERFCVPRDEARRIAANIAKLPELLAKHSRI